MLFVVSVDARHGKPAYAGEPSWEWANTVQCQNVPTNAFSNQWVFILIFSFNDIWYSPINTQSPEKLKMAFCSKIKKCLFFSFGWSNDSSSSKPLQLLMWFFKLVWGWYATIHCLLFVRNIDDFQPQHLKHSFLSSDFSILMLFLVCFLPMVQHFFTTMFWVA